MHKYFVLLFISLVCLASEPKFHFMDCVQVTHGFYTGCKGNVLDYTPGDKELSASYMVDSDDCKEHGFTQRFDETDLEACKR